MPSTDHYKIPLYTDDESPDLSTTGHYNQAMNIIDTAMNAQDETMDEMYGKIDGEIERAKGAENAIGERITQEVTARTDADTALDTAYKAADTALDSKLAAETKARTDADTELDTAYKAADAALGSRVDAETAAREEADSVIADSIGTKAETSALEKEVDDRKAYDTYLGSRIDNAISQGLIVIKTTSTAKSIGADALAKLIKSWPQVILVRADSFGNETWGGFMYPLERKTSSYSFYSEQIRYNANSQPFHQVVKISNSGEGSLTNTAVLIDQAPWDSIASKPFEAIGSGLKVVSDALTVDTSVLPSGSGIAIIDVDTGTVSEHYSAIQAAWPNCLLRHGHALYLPTSISDFGYSFSGGQHGTSVPGYSVNEYGENETNMQNMPYS